MVGPRQYLTQDGQIASRCDNRSDNRGLPVVGIAAASVKAIENDNDCRA
jgi:hypothetical protein